MTHHKTMVNAFTCTRKMVFKFNCFMLVETIHLTEFEYYISLVHVRVFIKSPGKMIFAVLQL